MRRAMEDCFRQGIMTDFISEHGTEVRNLLFTEFNIEDALEVCGEENYEKGVQDGLQTGVRKGLEKGLQGIIETCLELGVSREDTLFRIMEKFQLEHDAAEGWMQKYWK